MKKVTSIFSFLFLFSMLLHAQGTLDAYRFSREDLYGTARAMSMGGAFGALGGDQSGISINPAGIAVYRSSEVVGTLDLSLERSTVGNKNANRTQFNMDNLSFVGYFPLRNDAMSLINFGFSFNKLKSFNKNISAMGSPNSSLKDYIADVSWGIIPQDLQFHDDLPDPFLSQPWLPVLGYNSYLINPENDTGPRYLPLNTGSERPINKIGTREGGYVDNFDFTIGTTIQNVLNLGMSLSVKSISYSIASDYEEKFGNGDFGLYNDLSVSGAGFGAKFGVIYRPMNELRLGIAYHTPTWYALSETYSAEMVDNLAAYVADANYEPGNTYTDHFSNEYDLKTPGKFVASVAGVLGNRFIISMDYELMDYGKMQLMVPANSTDSHTWYDAHNQYISEDYLLASTVRLGMEYRLTPQMYGRLGYAWMQNAYDDLYEASGDPAIAWSNSIFRMEGDTHWLTGGVGYRFNRNFYLDMALVYKAQMDELYPFPCLYTDGRRELVIDASPFGLKNGSIRGLLTFGYRF
jgi:opacity protein-like surface antigen